VKNLRPHARSQPTLFKDALSIATVDTNGRLSCDPETFTDLLPRRTLRPSRLDEFFDISDGHIPPPNSSAERTERVNQIRLARWRLHSPSIQVRRYESRASAKLLRTTGKRARARGVFGSAHTTAAPRCASPASRCNSGVRENQGRDDGCHRTQRRCAACLSAKPTTTYNPRGDEQSALGGRVEPPRSKRSAATYNAPTGAPGLLVQLTQQARHDRRELPNKSTSRRLGL
jgi:hypothetical protein